VFGQKVERLILLSLFVLFVWRNTFDVCLNKKIYNTMIQYIAAFAVLLFLIFILREDPQPIAKVYRQPGKWFQIKYLIFYVLMSLRKRKSRTQTHTSGGDAGYGMRSRNSIKEMDCVQDLPTEHPSVWFFLLYPRF